jgi:hypothetical protein
VNELAWAAIERQLKETEAAIEVQYSLLADRFDATGTTRFGTPMRATAKTLYAVLDEMLHQAALNDLYEQQRLTEKSPAW